MKPYYINDLYGNKRDFADRDEILELVSDEVFKSNNPNYFKILEIYGFGGMGKTRLLEELTTIIGKDHPKTKVIRVSFEIYKNHQIVNNLTIIRKKLNFSCLFFDYAITILWNRIGIYELQNELMPKIYNELIADAIDLVMSFIPLEVSPSVENILKLTNYIVNKLQNMQYKNILESLSKLSDSEIIERMPIYLGMDIARHYDKCNDHVIFMFDAYIQSKPYSESNEWLLHMISHIGKGLFIIAGREKLLWRDDDNDILPYELQKFPEDKAYPYLKKYINNEDIINTIIKCSDCVPIYVDLAIDVYQKEYNINKQNIVDKSLFSDKASLVKNFINHLKVEWQDCILYLSVVRIFNKGIYKQLIRDINLPTPLVDYDEIINISLAKYSEKSDNLIKLHDVFCNNAVRILIPSTKLEIFHSYIKYFEYRGIYFDCNLSEHDLVVLFNNLLRMEIDISKNCELSVTDIEHTINIFFVLQDMRIRFNVLEARPTFTQRINDLLNFLNGILKKQDSTKNSVALLEKVSSPESFGKHSLSYNLIYKYNKSLTGQYEDLKYVLYDYDAKLLESDKTMWFYTHIKFYMSDYKTMDGDFVTALRNLNTMREYIQDNIFNRDNLLHLYRYIGHIYRYNMFLDNAEKNYKELLNNSNYSHNARIYLNTNICETVCYKDTEYFFSIFDDTLSSAKELGHTKNIGKLYYSRAIAYILTKEYDKAQNDINNSIRINMTDGYDSGCLFAYMAQTYLDYATIGYISTDTLKEISKLFKNGVYKFYKLPIYIMQNRDDKIKKIKHEFSWLDFDYTVEQYRLFLSKIKL